MKPITTTQIPIIEWVTRVRHITGDDSVSWKVASALMRKPTPEIWEESYDAGKLDDALNRYLNHEPLTRIAGQSRFCGHMFRVTRDVLDPRPDTEVMVHLACKESPRSVLELGTGSGCVICSISMHMPETECVGVDICKRALRVAQSNATSLAARCTFVHSDWCAEITRKFDVVVCNPPYVASADYLPPEVYRYDPHIALYGGGADGCDAHRIALPQALRVLNAGGCLIWEIGFTQGEWILEYAKSLSPNSTVEILEYEQKPRFLFLRTSA